ncbi:hypothetical protein JP74_12275 [Devosia sp. 17-2-E-8]|nr:hypothetical protein JP74_12275 [Devosia sp. 17-2-E-8]
MTGPLTLRPARAQDRDALLHILDATFRSTWEPELTAEANAAFRASTRVADYVDGYWQEFVVAESAGELVGMVHWQGDFIGALHVDPRQARRGIGSALLRHAEADMLAEGVKIAQLETDTFNLKARGFYAAHGYAEAAQYPDEEWNSGLTTVLMVKALQPPSQP